MDNLDKKIICILENNCRTPVSQIAKQLRANRNVIAYRLKNLKKQGIIKRYIASINLGKLGYSTYKIYLKIHQFNKSKRLIDYLINKKEIIHLMKLEGEYNLSFVLAARNVVELDDFLTEIKTRFDALIKELNVSIVVYSKIFKFEKLMLGEKTQPIKIEKYSSHEKVTQLDATDKKILHALAQNANLSYIDLRHQTESTLDTIKYRMKRLKKDMISSFRVLFDLSRFGYFHYVILIKTNNMTKSDEKKLIAWSTMKRNVMYFTKRIGNYDLEINAAITDIDDLRNIIDELQKEFYEKIDLYSTVIVSRVLKLTYVPF